MLGAVTQEAPGYEGLRNYVVNGGRPTAVPAFDASARQPMGAPGSALPGAPTPIPTSSARPGKMTNQRITYARLMTKYPSPADGGLDPDGIHEGDIAFVHRYDGLNSGYDTNKPTCMATLAQLNRIFKDYTPSTSDLGTMVMAARDANGNANDPRGVTEPPEEPPPPAPPAGNRPDPPTAAWVAHDAAMDAYRSSAQVAEYHREKVLYEKDYPKYRWRHCVALSQWTLDGVCCATEHEHTKDPMVGQGASNPGELFNIAIGGPTPRAQRRQPQAQHARARAAHRRRRAHRSTRSSSASSATRCATPTSNRRPTGRSRTTCTSTSRSPRGRSRGPPSSAT